MSDLKIVTLDPTSRTVEVNVANTGSRPGREVVQVYIEHPSTSHVTHPPKVLRAFAKTAALEPGTFSSVKTSLDKYAFAFWDEVADGWRVEKGEYTVHVGTSSIDLSLVGTVKIEEALFWKGI